MSSGDLRALFCIKFLELEKFLNFLNWRFFLNLLKKIKKKLLQSQKCVILFSFSRNQLHKIMSTKLYKLECWNRRAKDFRFTKELIRDASSCLRFAMTLLFSTRRLSPLELFTLVKAKIFRQVTTIKELHFAKCERRYNLKLAKCATISIVTFALLP